MSSLSKLALRHKISAALITVPLLGGIALPVLADLPTAPVGETPTAALPDFRQLVRDNQQAVVNIRVSGTVETAARQTPQLPFPPGSPFNDFFRHFGQQMPQPGPRTLQGLGSGFIIDPDGYILTNAHVVADADEIRVGLSDRRELTATLVGMDSTTDVALLKVEADNLPTVTTGRSADLEVGEWVMAMGSPFGLEHTATAGIVSAVDRNLPTDGYVPFIQTDVAVNPGNSGGPLFNTRGQVVGINSQIFSRSGGYMGISFAIPIETAIQVAQQLKTDGHVTRGYLGVMIQPLDTDLAQSFGLERATGALVAQVMPDSPAAEAGLEVGDVIVAYDGQPLMESSDLPYRVGTTAVGETVPLTVVRNGQEVTLDATIRPTEEDSRQTLAGTDHRADQARLNVAVADLSPEQRQQLGLGERGVLVEQVGQGPAQEAGVQPGDVILSLGNQDVKDAAQLVELVRGLPRDQRVPLLVHRDQGNVFLALKLPA